MIQATHTDKMFGLYLFDDINGPIFAKLDFLIQQSFIMFISVV